MSEHRPWHSNPPSDFVLAVARRVASELAVEGAEAVVIVGSHARGEAGPESDLDLLAVGDESYLPRLDVREGLLVGVSMQPFDVHQESFELPELVCEAVPGWSDALVLHDPEGLAASLVRRAREWTWSSLVPRCDEWVAEGVTARAETVHKLLGALRRGHLSTASVKRYLIATRLARALAVHHRLLYGSEARLWDLVAEAMGEEWDEAQNAALGQEGGSLEETCNAALRMYKIASTEAMRLLDDRQERVVRKARALIEVHLAR